MNPIEAMDSKNRLNSKTIIVFGGGAYLKGFSEGNYCFYSGSNPYGHHDCNFEAKPITDYVQQVNISDDTNEIQNYINLLVLALGLTYGEQNGSYIPFTFENEISPIVPNNNDRYFYYDTQDAAYK